MSENNNPNQPRHLDGTPESKGGQWKAVPKPSDTITLADPPKASAASIQKVLNACWTADEPITWGQVAHAVNELTDEELLGITADVDTATFRKSFEARANIIEGRDNPIPIIATRESNEPSLGNQSQNVAEDFMDDRLTKFDDITPFCQADWAEVSADGICYGIDVNPEHLLSIVVGPSEEFESEFDRMGALSTAEPDYSEKLAEFYAEEYGAELNGNEEMDSVEFYLPYEPGGAEKSTIEYMGDRVDKETKLNRFLFEAENGTAMKQKFAEKLGYRFVMSTNSNRQYGDGKYEKIAGYES